MISSARIGIATKKRQQMKHVTAKNMEEDSFSDEVDQDQLETFFFKERQDITYAEEGT